MADALNLRARVAHSVKALFSTRKWAIGSRAATAWRTKVNVTRQLADDEQVQAGHQLGLEARGSRQLVIANGWTEIGKETQRFAQAQNSLLRAQMAL